MNATDFWSNPKAAQKVIEESKIIRVQIEPLEEAVGLLEDAKVGYELAKESADKDLMREMLAEVDETLFGLHAKMDKIEQQSLLSGKNDYRNCFIAIQAGAGGTEAEDWASMLERMYLYYFEEMGFKLEEISRSLGPEAGISEVCYRVIGPFAYGNMNCERGTHRLARVSPFNAEGKRQTSFATVDVTPEFEQIDLVIPDKDLEIVAFVRASGPGGQNVNKVASAIRVTHLPTGLQVVASTFRDQPQNKAQALAVLQAKLELIEEERRIAELAAATGGKVSRDWGNQIRSYVFIDAELKRRRAERG